MAALMARRSPEKRFPIFHDLGNGFCCKPDVAIRSIGDAAMTFDRW
jgi:hypothetical protein